MKSGILGLLLALLGAAAHGQPSSLPRDDFWVPDGPVHATAETNGIVYVGGLFDYISPVSETGSAFDLASGLAEPNFPKFTGAINAILNDGAGGWFVGGHFTSAGGQPVTNLAHVRADRTVDPNWAPNPDNTVLALATDGVRLFVGGTFAKVGGQSRALLAALEPATGAVLAWQADCTTTFPKPSVNALTVSEGLLYVGGYFSFINGRSREHIGSVDAATGEVTEWFPNGYTGAEAGARVDALAVSGRIIYVGGTFASIGGAQSNGVVRHFIAALDTTKDLTNSVLAWNPSANGPVTAMALSCDTVYVAGAFTQIGGQPRNHVAAIDMVTGLATPWNPNANDDVLSVLLAGSVLYVGGKFSQIGGQARSFLAAVDTTTGQPTVWSPRADFGVAGMALSGGGLVTGGSLGPGGKLRKNAAAFDARTGRPLDWSPTIEGFTPISGAPYYGVYALAVSSTTVYLGGPFTEINGQPRNHLGAVDAVSGAVGTWNPGANGVIEALALASGVVYAGGRFTSAGGVGRTNLAAFNAATGAATAWNPRPNDKVKAILVNGSTVYAGGLFTQIAGQPRNRLAALDASTGTAAAWNPNVNDQATSLSILGSRLYLGGVFSTVGGQLRNRLAAVGLSSGSVECWDPNVRFTTPTGDRASAVNAVVASSNTVYAGGSFNLVAGQTRNSLAALNTNCPTTATAWDPGADSTVNALALARGSVVAGGVFQSVGGRYRPNLAVFPPTGSPTITLQPVNQVVGVGQSVMFEATATGQAPLAYQWQFNGTNLPGATSPTFSIAAAQASHSGEYVLVVTNTLGLVHSRPASLTVIQPLTITTQPESRTVAPGGSVTFTVVVTGNPPPSYQWRLNGVNIPGAVYPTLTLSNVQPGDGGNYSVVVANFVDAAISSATATLIVTSPSLNLANNLPARPLNTAASGVGSGDNSAATREAGEPNHLGLPGGRSVWMGWRAPATGIATFTTRGSAFDTVLAVYTGTTMANLRFVAGDEDRGGFLTSTASFNATNGIEYLIVVDGFAGATGPLTLSWSLDTSTVPFPRIITQPVSQSVFAGQTAVFSNVVNSATPATYQWFFGCQPVPGATNAMLTITNAQADDVGAYRVQVMNASTRVAISDDAFLEIGPVPKIVSQDKFENLFPELLSGGGGGSFAPAFVPEGFISVSLGAIETQTLDNTGSTPQPGEPQHCGVVCKGSRWMRLRPTANATLLVDTIGSAIDTVLAVYSSTNLLDLTAGRVACDNNGAPDGIRSLVRFNARASTDYLVVVDSVNNKGHISLNWKLGRAPHLQPSPPPPLVRAGDAAIFGVAISNNFGATVQWMWNGRLLAGATNAMLMLSNVTAGMGGTYSIIVSNFAGMATNTQMLRVDVPLLRAGTMQPNGMFRLWLPGTNAPAPRFFIDAASQLRPSAWTQVYQSPPSNPAPFIDLQGGTSLRYFRSRTNQ